MSAREIAAGLTRVRRHYLRSARRTSDGRWLTDARGIIGERMREAGLSEIYSASTDSLTPLGLEVRAILLEEQGRG